MTPQEIVDACMKQADFFAKRFDQRREYQWKINIGFWGVLLVGIATAKVQLPVWVAYIVVIAYCFMWLRGLWVANEKDKRATFHYSDTAAQIMAGQQSTFQLKEIKFSKSKFYFGFLTDWSMLFETLVTIGLVLILFTVNVRPNTEPTRVEVSNPVRIIADMPSLTERQENKGTTQNDQSSHKQRLQTNCLQPSASSNR